MTEEQSFAAFRHAPVDDLAMLGFIHAMQMLADALLDDEEKRRRLRNALDDLVVKARDADLTEEQLDYYLRAVRSVEAPVMRGNA